jgi:Protein of unknown function (DUF4038)/IPT/TIG domain/Putative collagen-binding domain of a collagenase/Fibronectin type III domain
MGWVMQIVAFRAGGGVPSDTQPPTAPSNLTATAVASNHINLTWTPSADNIAVTGYLVERCQGAGCSSFAQVAAPGGPGYSDTTGLAASTSYTYRICAIDAAGNASGYSNAATTTTQNAAVTVTFRQVNYATPQTPQSTVTVPFTAAQLAGDLNVVVVGWNDTTAQVQSVADTAGNAYVLAVGPTIHAGIATQSIYYARNIAPAAANTVTVMFTTAARYPDIRIAEYGGIDPISPVDATAAAQGTGTTSSSGSLTTTSANDLLVAANVVQTRTTGAGSGFTNRVITSPDADILEDRTVTAAGSYTATADVAPAAAWVMQMVAFRAAGGAAPLPTITSLNPAAGAAGTSVILTGANFGATQGGSRVTFNGAAAAPATWSATTIVAPVPAGATSGNVVVTVGGQASNGVNFTITGPTPTITGLTPRAGAHGAPVTITGVNFGSTQEGSIVAFNGTAAAPTSWSPTSVVAPVPAGAASGNVVVTVGGVASNGVRFTVTPTGPAISGLNPASGVAGTSVTITGVRFGPAQGSSTVTFNGTPTAPTSWSPTRIVTPVPDGATTGAVVVTVSGEFSNAVHFTVSSATTGVYPLKASSNGRYLVDQNNVPVLVVGDTMHGLSGNLSEADAGVYFANRQANHFNSVVIYAPCGAYVGCNGDGSTLDGIRPFTSGSSPSTYDLSTPNEVYFSRVDRLLNSAASHGLTVFLDPIETGDFLETLRNNGTANAFNYGAYLGTRYRNFPNVVWQQGEDFQTWDSSSRDNELVAQVMAGIASADSSHLQTIQLNYFRSYSNQDSAVLAPYLTFNMAYTYYETYDYVLASYNSSPRIPAFLGEANYEGENNTHALPGPATAGVIRRQVYWTLLSGGVGHFYGNGHVNHAPPEWRSNLDSPGVRQLQHSTDLFASYEWWNLVPDQSHQVVTAGYGTYNGNNADLTTASYVTSAWITDGTLAMAYCPRTTPLRVDLSRFARPVTARWYDPTSGTFQFIPGSPFSNSGLHDFTTPGANSDGDADWVLVLDATTSTLDLVPPTAPSGLAATPAGATQISPLDSLER